MPTSRTPRPKPRLSRADADQLHVVAHAPAELVREPLWNLLGTFLDDRNALRLLRATDRGPQTGVSVEGAAIVLSALAHSTALVQAVQVERRPLQYAALLYGARPDTVARTVGVEVGALVADVTAWAERLHAEGRLTVAALDALRALLSSWGVR